MQIKRCAEATHQHVDDRFFDVLLRKDDERISIFFAYAVQQICPHTAWNAVGDAATSIANRIKQEHVTQEQFVALVESHCNEHSSPINGDLMETIKAYTTIVRHNDIRLRYEQYMRYYLNHQCAMFGAVRDMSFDDKDIQLVIRSVSGHLNIKQFPNHDDINRRAKIITDRLQTVRDLDLK